MFQQDFLPFGAQYYRAPTPEPQHWQGDFEQIRRLGFNTVKLWAQWRWNNPVPGEFDFSDLDELMDLAQRHGLRVDINIILDVAPLWLYERHPDAHMVTADGRTLHPQTTPYRQIGGAPGPCYHHEAALDYRRAFVQAVAQRYCKHPAMALWDIWNEPELTCGILREPTQTNLVCYCDASVRAFRQWLQQRYGDIAALNRRWNRNYRSFDVVETPRDSGTFNDMIDWRLFFADTLTRETAMRATVIKQFDSIHPVMLHNVPMPHFNMVTCCSDDYGMAAQCDYYGNSVGSNPFAAALTVSAAAGRPVINAEIHALGGTTYDRPKPPSFNDIKRHILVPLARGVKGFLYWQYRPERLGTEAPAWGLTALDGTMTPWLDYNVRINQALQQYARDILAAQPPQAQVAIVSGVENQLFDWCVTHSIERFFHSVHGTFLSLHRANYNVDIVNTDQLLAQLGRYRVVFYPFPYYMREDVADALRQWVHGGGTLVSEAFFASVRSSDGLHSTTVPGYGFQDVFAAAEGTVLTSSTFLNAYGQAWSQQDQANSAVRMTLTQPLEFLGEGESFEGYYFREELVSAGAQVLARFADGAAAATVARYGAGRAVMIGSLPAYAVSKREDANAARFLASLAALGGVQPTAQCDMPGVRVDVLLAAEHQLLVVVSDREEPCVARIRRSDLRGATALNLLTGETIPVDESGCTVCLEARGCEVYLI